MRLSAAAAVMSSDHCAVSRRAVARVPVPNSPWDLRRPNGWTRERRFTVRSRGSCSRRRRPRASPDMVGAHGPRSGTAPIRPASRCPGGGRGPGGGVPPLRPRAGLRPRARRAGRQRRRWRLHRGRGRSGRRWTASSRRSGGRRPPARRHRPRRDRGADARGGRGLRDRPQRPGWGAPDPDLPRHRHLRRVPRRALRSRRPALPLSVHQLHQLRAALHHHPRRPLRPADHHHGRLRDVRRLRARVHGPRGPPLPCPAGVLSRLRSVAAPSSTGTGRRSPAIPLAAAPSSCSGRLAWSRQGAGRLPPRRPRRRRKRPSPRCARASTGRTSHSR